MNEPLPISSRARGGRWLPIILLPAVVLLCFMAHATVSGSRGSGSGDNYPGSDGGQKHRRRLAEEGKDGHEEAANVFAIALTGMNQSDVGWMMVAVIFSQLVLDEVLRRVEASVGANARACLREVYKELSTVCSSCGMTVGRIDQGWSRLVV